MEFLRLREILLRIFLILMKILRMERLRELLTLKSKRSFFEESGWKAFTENEPCGTDKAETSEEKVFCDRRFHVKNCEADENHHRDNFLNDLELSKGEVGTADPVAWHLKTVFKKSDSPTDQDHDPECSIFEMLEVAVPGEGHEDVG